MSVYFCVHLLCSTKDVFSYANGYVEHNDCILFREWMGSNRHILLSEQSIMGDSQFYYTGTCNQDFLEWISGARHIDM